MADRARGDAAEAWPRCCGDPQPGHHHQQGVLELQGVSAAPEQHFEVDLLLDPRHHRPGPDECGQRQKAATAPRKAPSCSGAPRKGRGQVVINARSTAEPEAGAADPQRGIKHRLLQHRDVVVEYRLGTGQEGRDRHHRGADRRQGETAPAHPGQAAAPEGTPDHGGKGHEPDRHRQVDMHHQRGTEKILQRKDILNARRA
jgi:hypothetical protein